MTQPLLEMRGLTKSFGGLRAVDSVDFSLDARGLYAVIGPNGAGKTTLFNLVSGMLSADHGEVRFEGRNILGMAPHRICRLGISRTLQVKSVFNGLSVYDNVWIAAHARRRFLHPLRAAVSFRDTDAEVTAILADLGLTALMHELAGNLSYGDLALLEMGIALATRPKLLLLDEPVAGMSPEETQRTVEKIRQLSRSLAVVLIEHDMEVVFGVADDITVMHHGSVICRGTPQVVSNDPQVQEAYLGGSEATLHA